MMKVASNPAELKRILMLHVLSGMNTMERLANGGKMTNLGGAPLEFANQPGAGKC